MSLRLTPLALASFSTAAIWPWLVSGLSTAMLSPIERISRASICGVPFHGEAAFLGHCPSCWAGSALLALTGVLLLVIPNGAVARAPAKRPRR